MGAQNFEKLEIIYIYKNQNVCMYVCNASVPFGGLLRGDCMCCAVEIFGPSRVRATICRIKFWWGCARRFARGGRIFAGFWAAAGADQRARALASVSSLAKLSKIRAGRSLTFDNEYRNRAPPAKRRRQIYSGHNSAATGPILLKIDSLRCA